MFLSADALGLLFDFSRARCVASMARLSPAPKAPGGSRRKQRRENCALPFDDLVPMDCRGRNCMARLCARTLPGGNWSGALPLGFFTAVGPPGRRAPGPSPLAQSPPDGWSRFGAEEPFARHQRKDSAAIKTRIDSLLGASG